MQLATAVWHRTSVKWWAVVFCCALFATVALAQPGVVVFSGQLPEVQLSDAQVSVVSGAMAARLEQAAVLVRAKKWEEAVKMYRGLASEQTDRVVATGENHFVNLTTYCQQQLAKLPPQGLADYRRRVDAVAEQMYREGLAARDERQLMRIVDEHFCSSWGDDALLALGELALERGDYNAARAAWEQISPAIRDSSGRTLWLALSGSDLSATWPEVDRAWQARNGAPDWSAYPDTGLDLADIRARLVLASIRAGELERAAVELGAFQRWHPQAEGRLGGQQVVLAAALERLLAGARKWRAIAPQADWPTFAGSQTRSAIAAPISDPLVAAWERPVDLTPPPIGPRMVPLPQGGAPPNTREARRPLSTFPIAIGENVLFADAAGIHAVNLTTGRPAIAAQGLIFPNERNDREQQVGQLPAMDAGLTHGASRFTLDAESNVVYGRVGELTTSRARPNEDRRASELVGLDLRREGLLVFRTKLAAADWSFDGTPVSDGDRLYIALRQGGATTQAAVACFEAATGKEVWRKSVCSADTPAGGLGDEITHDLLTLAGGRIYFNTNLGVIAAIEREHGSICWLTKYARATRKSFRLGRALPPHFARDPSPCCYSGGLLFIAPSDTPKVFALDASTGKVVWTCDQLPDVVQLLGVTGQQLVVSGDRLAALDVRTGKPKWMWPESPTAEIHGLGRGLLAGNEIFWPTDAEIYVVNPSNGGQTRPPIDLRALGGGGANLAAAAGRLIVAGYDKLMVFAALPARPQPAAPASTTDAARTGRLSDQSLAR